MDLLTQKVKRYEKQISQMEAERAAAAGGSSAALAATTRHNAGGGGGGRQLRSSTSSSVAAAMDAKPINISVGGEAAVAAKSSADQPSSISSHEDKENAPVAPSSASRRGGLRQR